MFWRFSFFFFCITSVGVCGYYDDDDDDDFDDEYIVKNTVSYAGMSFECDTGCGDVLQDPDMREIDGVFQKCLKYTINKDSWLYDEEHNWICVQPWTGEENCYDVDGHLPSDSRKTAWLDQHDRFQDATALFYEDLEFYHQKKIRHLNAYLHREQSRLAVIYQFKAEGCVAIEIDEEGQIVGYDIDHAFATDIDQAIQDAQKEISSLEQQILEEDREYDEFEAIADRAFQEIDGLFKKIFVWCLEHHQPEGIAFNAALEHFITGDLDAALGQIRFLIDLSEKRGLGDQLISKLYLLQGQVQSEFCLYADAINALTTAIQKDPSSKEAYFERAAAYFELGQFDQALGDYLSSDMKNLPSESRLQWKEMTQLSAGIGIGIIEGAQVGITEFIPNALSTFRGLGNGLWAFCSNPVGASQDFANAATQCVEYLKNHTSLEIVQQMVPELRELIQHYDELSEFQRGKLIGHVIGEYGIDIFLSQHGIAVAKHYLDLKKANQLLTLEALSSPENTRRICEEASKRWASREQVFQKWKLKIEPEKQNKHLSKYMKPNDTRSILTHPNPQELVYDFAGAGQKINDKVPGSPGFRERVNFQEKIGIWRSVDGKEAKETTMGMIIYSKNGVHIVPLRPSE